MSLGSRSSDCVQVKAVSSNMGMGQNLNQDMGCMS